MINKDEILFSGKQDQSNSPAVALINKKRRRTRDSSLDRHTNRVPLSSLAWPGIKSSKSVSNLFQKTLSFRRKSHHCPRSNIELSTEDSAPGVLKVFGDSIAPGAHYKSVLASATSTCEDLIKEALDRYNISTGKSNEYVLCDVIGRMAEGDGRVKRSPHRNIWMEECVRVIDNSEKPLTLQAYWKPAEGYARRFELRKRHIQTEQTYIQSTNHKTEPTVKRTDSKSIMTKCGIIDVSPVHTSRHAKRTSVSEMNDLALVNTADTALPSQHSHSNILKACHSYLICLKSYDIEKDFSCLICPLARKEATRMGRGADSEINLCGPDILDNHCVFIGTDTCLGLSCDNQPVPSNLASGDNTGPPFMSIEPTHTASVRINGEAIYGMTAVHSGDVLCVGEHYVFIYQEHGMANEVDNLNRTINLLSRLTVEGDSDSLQSATIVKHPREGEEVETSQVQLSDSDTGTAQLPDEDVEPKEVQDWRKQRSHAYDSDQSRLKLSFMADKQDELFCRMVALMEGSRAGFRLAPAYMMSMAIEYSAAKHDQLSTRQLLIEIATKIQKTVWEKTKILEQNQSETYPNPHLAMDELVPFVQPVVLWMSNSLELLHFLRHHMGDYVMDPAVSLPPGTRTSLAQAEDEVLSILEEVAMYTFQQTVYYITKTLYCSLSAILESNPFTDEDNVSVVSSGDKPTVDTVLSVYQTTLSILEHNNLNPKITSQLFCYLFFFTSTSLFNMLICKGTELIKLIEVQSKKPLSSFSTVCEILGGSRYYKWSRGAQLRGNLDAVEAWAAGNGLQKEATLHMKKINSVADLLATPRVQLLQADWQSLRRDYPCLSAAQLHQILMGYHIGGARERPNSWFPSHDEANTIHNADALFESYSNHPPLVLPGDGFLLDLSQDINDVSFHYMMADIDAAVGTSDDDADSGLSVSQCSPDISRSSLFDVMTDSNSDDQCSAFQQYEKAMTFIGSDVTFISSDVTMPKLENQVHSINIEAPKNHTNHHIYSEGHSQWDVISDKKNNILDWSQSGQRHKSRRTRSKESRSRHSYYGSCGVNKTVHSEQKCNEHHKNKHNINVDHVYENILLGSKKCKDAVGLKGCAVTEATPVPPSRKKRSHNKAHIPPQPSNPAPKLLPGSNEPDSMNNNDLTADKTYIEVLDRRTRTKGLRVLPLTTDDHTPCHSPKPSKSPSPIAFSPISVSMSGMREPEVIIPEVESEPADEEIIVVDLMKGERGLGLGLIDGLFTPLRRPGIYVRTLVPDEPAVVDGRLQLGDRILAVDGTSVVGADYQSAMDLIRDGGQNIKFLVAKTTTSTARKIAASDCQ